MNYILIFLCAIILTSYRHTLKIHSTLHSNSQKTKVIVDSTYQNIKNTEKNNQTQIAFLSQTFDQPLDTLKPGITNDKSVVSNMPAASYDGKYIIVKFHNYSCCFSDGEFLSLYNKNEEVQRIQFYPSEDVEWTDITFDSVKAEIRHLINARNYYTMNSIHKDSIKIIKQTSKIDLSIELSLENKKYQSKIFRMDSI